MTRRPARAIALAHLLALGLSAASLAQAGASASAASPPVAAAPAPRADAAAPAPPPARPADGPAREPLAAWHIAEDEHVRVQELRVRGESRQITVQPKLPGARPYEIAPASGALDPSQRGRLAPGTSQWRVLNF
jgi:hypothetical protein